MKENALTLDEAIAEGFKYCNIQEDEEGANLTKLEDILSGKQLWDARETDYYLCDKQPRHHSIGEEEISDMIQESLDCQEEFYIEDGFDDALEGCDDLISALTTTINQNLRKHNFYFTSDIKLLPNPPKVQKKNN